MHLSNPNLIIEFNSFDEKDEKQLFNLGRFQRVYNIYRKPLPVFIRSERSHSFEHAKIKKMHILLPSLNGRKHRHFSTSNLPDQLEKADPIFTTFKNAYKIPKLPRRIQPETIGIRETTRSEQEQIDVGATPPTDDSFFFENLESFRGVEIDGVNILEEVWNTVSIAEMKILTEMETGKVPEKDGILFPDFDEKFRNIAFTWACIRGLTYILSKLESSGADINNICFTSATPLMYAAFAGQISSLKYLVERGANLNYVSPIYGHCALHSATVGNHPEAAEILLDNGADLNNVSNNPDMIPLLHYAIRIKSEEIAELFINRGANPTYKNHIGETPLHVACGVQSLKCCELLLQKPEVDVNALDEMHRTPLHHAIMATGSNVKIVELLLKHGALINQIDGKGFSPFHIAALEEKAECVEMFIRNGADLSATTSKGVSALNIILRKIPECFEAFRMKLDSSILLRHPDSRNRESEMRFDFAPLLPSDDRLETCLINIFLQEKLTYLLIHPLVTTFLYLKWERIRKFYLLNIFLYTLMVIFMSIYVLMALAYECLIYTGENIIRHNGTCEICYYFNKRVIIFDWYIWLALVCWMIPRKILNFITHKNYKEYICNIENTLDTIVIISVFATSFFYTGRTYHWQKYIGAFSVLCAWTNLMLMIGQLPGFGTYVAMFTHILYEFALLFIAYSGLLIGFTLSFCTIFDGEPSFANLLTSTVKILTMMTGELDFEELINHQERNISGYNVVYNTLSVSSQVLFCLFVIFIVVILMNLLVGITVHDIKGLRNQAGLSKLIRTTKLIVYTEMLQHKIKLSPILKRIIANKAVAQLRNHILVVRPLNPQEKRIPRLILEPAYEIAKKNSRVMDNKHPACREKISYIPKKKGADTKTTLETTIAKLNLQFKINIDQLDETKVQLREVKRILGEIILKLS